MAIDTRDKRASAFGRGLVALALLPLPDASISQQDRVQVFGNYRVSLQIARLLSGVATGTLAGALNLTLGAIELLSGVAAGTIAASLSLTYYGLLSGAADSELSTQCRVTLETSHDGMITGY